MTVDPSPLLANPLVYTVAALVLVAVALSKKVEDSPILRWVRGAFSWAATRQERADTAEVASLRSEVATLAQRVSELDDRLGARDRIIALRDTEIAVRDEYIDAVAAWYRRLREWATENGLVLLPPPLQVFSVWLATRARTDPAGSDPPTT